VILVVDASAVVAALIDDGSNGAWAARLLGTRHLAGPHLLPVEVSNILRRAAIKGDISDDNASLAHDDLLALRIDLFPFEPFAERVWELRFSVTAYDAWYVALAETLAAPLATLDTRLSRATGPRCPFELPP
jgi:predicted nucleic acid-binding protein